MKIKVFKYMLSQVYKFEHLFKNMQFALFNNWWPVIGIHRSNWPLFIGFKMK